VSDLTAIDVLIDPDEATMERARAVNARMLQSLPQGGLWMTPTEVLQELPRPRHPPRASPSFRWS
jgi:hypothetical protein